MFCKKCGKQLKDGAQFCIYCGEKVTIPGVSAQPEVKVSEPEVKPVEIPVPEVEETYDSEPEEERDVSRNLIPFIIIGVVVIVAVIAALGYFILKGRSEDSADDIETQVAQEEEAEPEESLSNDITGGSSVDVPEQESEESVPDEPVEEVSEEGVHTYELIVRDVTWGEAYEDCISRGGHLVRINSDEEYWAILQQIASEDKNNIKFWLGGTRGFADSYEYRWAYEDWSFGNEILNEDDKYISYWLSGEPSYEDEAVGSQEIYMNMFYMRSEERWVWNDVPDDLLAVVSTYAGTVGYICEYED